jgi:thiol-disulfide isomerase/thioredoxin
MLRLASLTIVAFGCTVFAVDDAVSTGDEPADGAQAADRDDDSSNASPETAAVDRLLREAQKLEQRQDVDGLLRVLKQALRVDPKHRIVLRFLCHVLQSQAEEASRTGEPQEAYSKYKEAAAYARTMRDHFDDLEASDRQLVAGLLYNEACAFAIDHDADKALTSLDEAVDAGFAEAEQMAKDTDLTLLIDRNEFKRLLERASRNAATLRREEGERARAADEQMLEEIKKRFAAAETFAFDFALPDLDDEPVSLADYQGKVLIVDIWGTWSQLCRMEVADLVELKKRFEEKGFDIVGINYENLDPGVSKEKVVEFAKDNGVNYKCVIGDDETQSQIPEFGGYPTTLFIDRSGKVRLKIEGKKPIAMLEWIVNELLSEKAPSAKSDDDP